MSKKPRTREQRQAWIEHNRAHQALRAIPLIDCFRFVGAYNFADFGQRKNPSLTHHAVMATAQVRANTNEPVTFRSVFRVFDLCGDELLDMLKSAYDVQADVTGHGRELHAQNGVEILKALQECFRIQLASAGEVHRPAIEWAEALAYPDRVRPALACAQRPAPALV